MEFLRVCAQRTNKHFIDFSLRLDLHWTELNMFSSWILFFAGKDPGPKGTNKQNWFRVRNHQPSSSHPSCIRVYAHGHELITWGSISYSCKGKMNGTRFEEKLLFVFFSGLVMDGWYWRGKACHLARWLTTWHGHNTRQDPRTCNTRSLVIKSTRESDDIIMWKITLGYRVTYTPLVIHCVQMRVPSSWSWSSSWMLHSALSQACSSFPWLVWTMMIWIRALHIVIPTRSWFGFGDVSNLKGGTKGKPYCTEAKVDLFSRLFYGGEWRHLKTQIFEVTLKGGVWRGFVWWISNVIVDYPLFSMLQNQKIHKS